MLIEWVATIVENVIILCAILDVAGKKHRGIKLIALHITFAISSFLLVTALNRIAFFSFITPIIGIIFISTISSKAMAKGNIIVRLTICILAMTVILSVDYIMVLFMGIIFRVPDNFFGVLTTPGVKRSFFIVVDKLCDILIYILCRKSLQKIGKLTTRFHYALLGVSVIIYAFTQYLFSIVMSSEIATLQSAIIFSWFFSLCFIFALISLFISLSKTQYDRQLQKHLQTENALMSENYRRLHETQTAYAKNLHDFKHHLTALNGLLERAEMEEVTEYIHSLIGTSTIKDSECYSGSDIVDAIINCKYTEAQKLDIEFTYSANFHAPCSIRSIDICGILANQIDNAFEACMQIEDSSKRKVIIDIYQVQDFAIFRVENTVLQNPFLQNPKLKSTKPDATLPHGMGLVSIQYIADQYDGYMRNEYKDGMFISVVSLCNPPFDT